MKEIIYRVTLGPKDRMTQPTLRDYQQFVFDAQEFNIPADTPVALVPSNDDHFAYMSGPLMVQKVVTIN